MRKFFTVVTTLLIAATFAFAQGSMSNQLILFDNLLIEEDSSVYSVHFKMEAYGYRGQRLSVAITFVDENGNILDDSNGDSCVFFEYLTPQYDASEWKDYVATIDKDRISFRYSGRFGFFLSAFPAGMYQPIAKSQTSWFRITMTNSSSNYVPVSGTVDNVSILSEGDDVLIRHKLSLSGLKGRNVSLVYNFYDPSGRPLSKSGNVFRVLDNVTPSYDGSTWETYEERISFASIPFSSSGRYGFNIEAYAPGQYSSVFSTPIMWFDYTNNSYSSGWTGSTSASSSSNSSSGSIVGALIGAAAIAAAIHGLTRDSGKSSSNSSSSSASSSSGSSSSKVWQNLKGYSDKERQSVMENHVLYAGRSNRDSNGNYYFDRIERVRSISSSSVDIENVGSLELNRTRSERFGKYFVMWTNYAGDTWYILDYQKNIIGYTQY